MYNWEGNCFFKKWSTSPFILITNTLCPGADIIWRHHRLPLSTKSPTDVQNCTVEFFKRIESITKDKNHSQGTTVLSLMTKPTLNSHWQTTKLPWLWGQLQQPLCLVSPWGQAEKYTQWEVSRTIPQSSPASEPSSPLGGLPPPGEEAPPWEVPQTYHQASLQNGRDKM